MADDRRSTIFLENNLPIIIANGFMFANMNPTITARSNGSKAGCRELRKEMIKRNKTLRTCENGHRYYKSSDCPTCPVCEGMRKPKSSFLSLLAAPARRALENQGITSIQQLSKYSQSEVLKFHGMGPSSIPILKKLLKDNGLSFKSE